MSVKEIKFNLIKRREAAAYLISQIVTDDNQEIVDSFGNKDRREYYQKMQEILNHEIDLNHIHEVTESCLLKSSLVLNFLIEICKTGGVEYYKLEELRFQIDGLKYNKKTWKNILPTSENDDSGITQELYQVFENV